MRRLLLVSVAGALVPVALWAGWRLLRPSPPGYRPPGDPRLGPTPYLNVRPGVAYVGDRACARCHRGITESYHRHPMGRSLAPAAELDGPEEYGESAHNPFAAFGVSYRAEVRGRRVFHRELARTLSGDLVLDHEEEVRYGVGSGTRARSYLVERAGGYLYESPLTWYSRRGRWDLSPGYGPEHPHFGRAVIRECLFCHANRVEPDEDVLNRYELPVFRGYAVGCERCHGPGELHVREQEGGETFPAGTFTIVNPARLEAPLREAVCEQCHLHGRRIPRRGRSLFEYRPGLPLHAFASVFVRGPEAGQKFVGHVEQMHASRCYRASEGRLGCTSCHDPHEKPAPGQRVEFFRARCLACHAGHGCSLAEAERRATQPDDSCAACHMPRVPASDIPHASVTDHRVPRRPSPAGGEPGEGSGGKFVHFHRGLVAGDDPEVRRDLGVALAWRLKDRTRRDVGEEALPLLEGALREWPDDPLGRDALGDALWLVGRRGEALAELERNLADHPGRELTLEDAATLAGELGEADKARGYWHRVLKANPWNVGARVALGRLDAGEGDWAGAGRWCREALRVSPADVGARQLLVRCHLREGRRREAEAELERIVTLQPGRALAWREWFAAQQ
jgi:hypothetical protein